MNSFINTHISFNSKFSIIIINSILYVILLGVLINSNKEENVLIFAVILTFIISSILILFFLNWILKRVVFQCFYLKDGKTGLEVLDIISSELKISIKKNEDNIFSTSYTQKKILGDIFIKDVFFILNGRRVFLNIQNKNDSIFIYREDFIEKKIRKILTENSQLNIMDK